MIDRDGHEWLTYAQAADRYDVKPATLWKWASRGVIRSFRYRGRVAVRVCDVTRAVRSLRLDGAQGGRGKSRRHAMTRTVVDMGAETVRMGA